MYIQICELFSFYLTIIYTKNKAELSFKNLIKLQYLFMMAKC